MEKEPPLCICCNQPMKLVKTHKTIPSRPYRIRVYFCNLCNYSESVYADGSIDEANVNSAVKKASKLYE